MSFGHLLDCFTGEFIITHAQWIGRFAYSLVIGRLNIFGVWFTIFYCVRLQYFATSNTSQNKTEYKKTNRNGRFRDITLRSVVANWASISLILGAQPDFYSLWASGRPLICIPVDWRSISEIVLKGSNSCAIYRRYASCDLPIGSSNHGI